MPESEVMKKGDMSDLRVWRCDRCNYEMMRRHCKVICPNCGARWDCSDVTIWVGDGVRRTERRSVRRSVRPYRQADHAALARQWSEAPTAAELGELAGGTWVLLTEKSLCGYAALFTVPGLPHMRHLLGDVLPEACPEGAEQLLEVVLEAVRQGNGREQAVRQVTFEVDDLASSAARFLQARGFALEHESWQMRGTLPPQEARQAPPEGFRYATLPFPHAVEQFISVYDESFGATPWYQPYSRDEVVSELQSGDDLLFVCEGDTPVGVAWLRHGEDEGEVEPVGIVPWRQGMGLGRGLFLEAMWRLSEGGARTVRVGVWRRNEGAVRLYRRAGLQLASRRYYLAYELA